MSNKNCADKIRKTLGPEKVFTDEFTLKDRRRDFWMMSALDDLQGRRVPNPACVVKPKETKDVVEVVNLCRENATPLITFGLGSGVCGGIRATGNSVLLDMSSMTQTRLFDIDNLLVTFEAGVRGADAEAAVAKRGMTIGHYPQSIDVSSVGGWVATRSSGQFSTGYGNVENVVLGLEAVLPDGSIINTRLVPRASTGPDLKQLLIGSEGTLGVITAVTFGLRWKAEKTIMKAYYAPTMEAGFDFQRFIIQSGWQPAVMRQYDASEVARLFADFVRGDDALILLVHEGPASYADAQSAACAAAASAQGCPEAPEAAVQHWFEERNNVTNFDDLAGAGIVADTIEISATWDRIASIYHNVVRAMKEVDEVAVSSGHSSHCYRSGINIYFTFAARPENKERMAYIYNECWSRAMRWTIEGGGTISHHHGIGRVRNRWLPEELGDGGLSLLKSIKKSLDPANFMNPGVLIND